MNTQDTIATELSVFLASTYTLYLKVQNYHWNIEGREFFAVHQFTETLYNELFTQVDEIAERVRTLGKKAPGTFRKYLELSHIQEASNEDSCETVMTIIQGDYQTLIADAKKIIALAEDSNDNGTADLLTPYVSSYEKSLWMMKSFGK